MTSEIAQLHPATDTPQPQLWHEQVRELTELLDGQAGQTAPQLTPAQCREISHALSSMALALNIVRGERNEYRAQLAQEARK